MWVRVRAPARGLAVPQRGTLGWRSQGFAFNAIPGLRHQDARACKRAARTADSRGAAPPCQPLPLG